jgi:hypothetical protein
MDPGLGDQHLPIGSVILSADGQRLGEVAGVDSGFVRVQAMGMEDYWIVLHAIESIGADRVTLAFPAQQLEAYRQNSPPP